MKRVSILLVLYTLFSAWGCSRVALVPAVYDFKMPASLSKIPVRAALYLPHQFNNKTLIGNRGGTEVMITIGEAMKTGAEKAMQEIFQDVVITKHLGANLAGQSIAVIVTPEIVDADNRLIGYPPASKWDSRIVCKWTITRPDGKLLYMNTITGEGQDKAFTTAFTFADKLGQSMIPAVKDHYDKLINHLLAVKWWEGM